MTQALPGTAGRNDQWSTQLPLLAGLKAAARSGHVEAAGPFWSKPGQVIAVRDRSGVLSATLRKPEHLPPREVEVSLLALLDANFGAKREELILAAARLFGFASTSAQLRGVIEAGLEVLAAEGAIQIADDQVTRRSPNPNLTDLRTPLASQPPRAPTSHQRLF